VSIQKRMKRYVRLGFILAFMISLLACQATSPKAPEEQAPVKFDTILVLPFENMSARYGEGKTVRCEICGNIFKTGPVSDNADMAMTEQMIRITSEWQQYTLIHPSQAKGVLAEILASQGNQSLSRREALVKTARALDADVVLTGHVYRSVERVGERYSIDTPASVLFDVDLVNADDGRLLWSSYFKETQKALLDNLLEVDKFFKRGAAWISAEELAAFGMKDVLKDFPHP
jgi:hypothetical protein